MSSLRSDVFLSHHTAEKPAVEEIARKLLNSGISPWLDIWNLIPGDPWQEEIERALAQCTTCVVFIGPNGTGPWQNEEMRVAIARRVRTAGDQFHVIPVLLPGASMEVYNRLPLLMRTGWVQFLSSIQEEDAFYRLMCGILRRRPGPGPVSAAIDGRCPYRGLQAFNVEDSNLFFGRDALKGRALQALEPAASASPQAQRFLALVGASGSGKSSLARAGIAAAIRFGEIIGSERWPVVICRPGSDPVESLAIALTTAPMGAGSFGQLAELIRSLSEEEAALHRFVRLALSAQPGDVRFLLLVDQFEELFILCQSETSRRSFLDNLLYASSVIGGQCSVVIAMRADAYAYCAAYQDLAATIAGRQILIGPMAAGELRTAIERPAQMAGCEFERGLVDVLLDDAANQPGTLPLLQHALLEMWERRSGRYLTLASYEASGRLSGALERRAEAIYAELDEAHKEACHHIFLRLIQPGRGAEITIRRVPIAELARTVHHETVPDTLRRLAAPDARLLTTQRAAGVEGEAVVEISHEALIRSWSRLRGWLEEDRANLLIQSRLTDAAHEWRAAGANEGFLYRGAKLAQAGEWAEQHDNRLNETEQAFLRASLEVSAEETRISDAAAIDQLELSARGVWLDVREMEHWLRRGELLTKNLERHRRQLERYRRNATQSGDDSGVWVLADPERQFQHDTLATLILRLERFRDGLMAAAAHVIGTLPALRQLTIDDQREVWDSVIAAIADETVSPEYRGLRIAAQSGLVPLGRDPLSRLWEFAHLPTGTPPARDVSGRLRLSEQSAVVLVLIPGGPFRMGATRPTPSAPLGTANVDPYALDDEAPVSVVELAPYFIAKHQMTQGQWLRAQGYNPSMFRPDSAGAVSLLHPVECVSRDDCMTALGAVALTLPTEAQWECAARGGSGTVWWLGNDPAALDGKANLMMAAHTPVGFFNAPNAYGLHDVIGNVWEWCRDPFGLYTAHTTGGDAARVVSSAKLYVSRGGSFFNTPPFARSAIRYFQTLPTARFNNRGLRPSRALDV